MIDGKLQDTMLVYCCVWSTDQFRTYKFVTGQCIFQSATFKLSVMIREKYGNVLGQKIPHFDQVTEILWDSENQETRVLFGHNIQYKIKEIETDKQMQ